MHAKQPTTETTLSRLADPSHATSPRKLVKAARYTFFSHLTRFDDFPVDIPNMPSYKIDLAR
jgi:hypothetical protein